MEYKTIVYKELLNMESNIEGKKHSRNTFIEFISWLIKLKQVSD